MTCKFEIGQRVVCVPRQNPPGTFWTRWPVYPQANEVYTIRAIAAGTYAASGKPGVGLRFKEIGDLVDGEGRLNQWDYRDFQPLSWRDIDISVFTRMLDKGPELVR